MKNINHILLFLTMSILSGCESPTNLGVDLKSAPPRLVINAGIIWDLDTDGKEQTIRLTTTTDYFNKTIPTVSNAIVYIENNSGTTFNFIESEFPKGNYICLNFEPVVGETYHLTVIHKGEVYKATETMISLPSVQFIKGTDKYGYENFTVSFRDPIDEENFYLRYDQSEYTILNDRFRNGTIISFNDVTIYFRLYGISKQYYNYLNILLQNILTVRDPFTPPPPGVVRGNIINTTNFDNFALGYFYLSRAAGNPDVER